MGKVVALSVSLLALIAVLTGSTQQGQTGFSLASLEPEHYRYAEAERCANCHDEGSAVHRRAVGVAISSGEPEVTGKGWLSSVHARSQSHEDRVNTACAWCHAPTTTGATRDSAAAAPIPKGTWQGVTCGACHPVGLADSLQESLVTNLLPGSDRSDPASYTFIDRSDPSQMNAQCQYCHNEFHGILVPTMADHLHSGMLRCIDCHMAGYRVAESGSVERMHNFKVEANGPISCSGEYGTQTGCHANATEEWMRTAIPNIKAPRADW
jgi:hypothetical protein